jgi:glycosyltransferase involved in cell wall biosynthesis
VKVLHIIHRLNCHGAGRQLVLLATGLARPPFELQVALLADRGPLATELDQAGIVVHHLPRRRLFDPTPLWNLRQLVRRSQPEVIHVWGMEALRFLRFAMPWGLPPLVVSSPNGTSQPGLLDRWLLRRAARVVVSGELEANSCARMGIGEAKLVRIAPAAAVNRSENIYDGLPPLPPNARCVACIGELDTFVGFRDTLWAFDILRYLYPDLQVLLLADGRFRPQLEAFVQNISGKSSIHFLGDRADPGAVLARAEIVWVADGSVSGALAAMAVARPVLAWRCPALEEIVVPEKTGLLVPPGRQAELARETRLLLDDPERRREWGEAARQRARTDFTPAELVRRVTLLYQEVENASAKRAKRS